LPLRSLVPRKVNNVFVASRSLSATYSAAGSARVIPITMAAGEAAGAAAWLCAKQNITPHDMMHDSKWVKQLQISLREWGADIGDKIPLRKTTQVRQASPEQDPLKPDPAEPQPPAALEAIFTTHSHSRGAT
jgi:hypothetical protein